MHDGMESMGLARRRLAGAGGLMLLLAGCGGGNTEGDPTPVAPTLTIASDAPGEATGPFTVRFTFSAAVSDFATNRILLTNAFLNGATLTKLSDTVYSLVVTPTSDRQSVAEVKVLAGAFKDATGTTASTVDYSFGQPIDTVVASNEPTLVISHTASALQATGPVTFTFTFSVDVGTSFTASSITPSVGTVTTFTRVSGTSCTAVVTLPAGTNGLLLLQVLAGAFKSTANVPSQQDYGLAVFFSIPA